MPKFEREVDIDAPVEQVWDVLIDPNQWQFWFPGIESVSQIGTVLEGATFKWTDEGKTGQGSIIKMEPNRRLKVMTQMGDDKDKHEFTLKATGGFLGLAKDECKITYELDTMMGGGIISNFIAGGNPKDAIRVKKAMHAFRRLVEGQ